jgi:hypothetical protein
MQSKDECDILRRVHALVQANYVDGKPRHHQDSARQVEWTPGASCFLIIDRADYDLLDEDKVNEILRHRNIIIRNSPPREYPWSLDTLRQLGSLDQPRDIQGIFSTQQD